MASFSTTTTGSTTPGLQAARSGDVGARRRDRQVIDHRTQTEDATRAASPADADPSLFQGGEFGVDGKRATPQRHPGSNGPLRRARQAHGGRTRPDRLRNQPGCQPRRRHHYSGKSTRRSRGSSSAFPQSHFRQKDMAGGLGLSYGEFRLAPVAADFNRPPDRSGCAASDAGGALVTFKSRKEQRGVEVDEARAKRNHNERAEACWAKKSAAAAVRDILGAGSRATGDRGDRILTRSPRGGSRVTRSSST